MDKELRKIQLSVLKAFSACPQGFVLAGGTALELFYMHHRFSADLDFFATNYSIKNIKLIVKNIEKAVNGTFKFESEIELPDRAKARVYSLVLKGAARNLKIDFVEEVLIAKPRIKRFMKIPVYDARDIYYHKILAISGTEASTDELGRDVQSGRNQSRDVFDVYFLSKKIMPLSEFLMKLPVGIQRRIVHWYRNFSRQELKLGLLDLDIYDRDFDVRKMVIYIEREIKVFISQVAE